MMGMKQKVNSSVSIFDSTIPFGKKHSFRTSVIFRSLIVVLLSVAFHALCGGVSLHAQEPGDLQLKVKAYKGILLHRG